jgi:hypothetical protein
VRPMTPQPRRWAVPPPESAAVPHPPRSDKTSNARAGRHASWSDKALLGRRVVDGRRTHQPMAPQGRGRGRASLNLSGGRCGMSQYEPRRVRDVSIQAPPAMQLRDEGRPEPSADVGDLSQTLGGGIGDPIRAVIRLPGSGTVRLV